MCSACRCWVLPWSSTKYRERRYDTLLLSAAKWMRGLYNASVSGKPFLLFIEWPDGLYWIDAAKAGSHV